MIKCKYKAGDKLICINNFILTDDPSNTIKGTQYNAGITIKINHISDYDIYPVYATYNGEEHLFTNKEINDNFISIAELRDNQINSILDD